MKHCIVTPDIIGPVKNGGIGTACFNLARFFRHELNYDVSILFTGPMENKTQEFWEEYYNNIGISFYSIGADNPYSEPVHNGYWFMTRSYRVDRWLRKRNFDQIHFQEWQGNGFVPMQAKRTGNAYNHTTLTCTVHSSHQWINEGNLQFLKNGVADMLQKHVEKYSVEQADVSIFPSRHMLEWCQKNKWKIRNPCVVQYIQLKDSGNISHDNRPDNNVTELCFFGRLETRKGLEVFIDALNYLVKKHGRGFLPKISFLGKQGATKNGPANQYIDRALLDLGIDYKIINDLDSSSSINYLKSTNGLVAVIPSLLDNLPFTVIECLQNKIPLLASNIGGIPELIGSKEHLFDVNPKALSNCLEGFVINGIKRPENLYNLKLAKSGWKDLSKINTITDSQNYKVNDITICIAYYNYGKYLPHLLKSLDNQSLKGFSLVVVNDGSTDELSNQVFSDLEERYSSNISWRFIKKENGGIGETRNYAASQADSKLIVFMDADNEAEPIMVETMLRGINASGADCLTCYMTGFKETNDKEKKVVYRYTPTGGCIPAAIFGNCLGDANFIIKKEVFNNIGGFNADRTTSFEDWEFLLHLLLEGYTLDTIPEFIFQYRHTEAGFSRTTSSYRNHQRIINRLKDYVPEYILDTIKDIYAQVNLGIADTATITDKKNQTEIKNRNILSRISNILTGGFNEKKYLDKHKKNMMHGTIKWIKYPRFHYIIFNFPL